MIYMWRSVKLEGVVSLHHAGLEDQAQIISPGTK